MANAGKDYDKVKRKAQANADWFCWPYQFRLYNGVYWLERVQDPSRPPSPSGAEVVFPAVPDDFPVKLLKVGEQAEKRATCFTCGRSWDDSIATSWTPAPSARCPFEYFHKEN